MMCFKKVFAICLLGGYKVGERSIQCIVCGKRKVRGFMCVMCCLCGSICSVCASVHTHTHAWAVRDASLFPCSNGPPPPISQFLSPDSPFPDYF